MNKALVQRRFSDAAVNYDRNAAMQREIVDKLLTQLGPQRDSVVDLGCGTGYAIAELRKSGFETIDGLDISLSMLKIAKSALPHVRFTQGDIEALPFENEAFSAVLSSSAVQWCNLSAALENIYRVIKPGGQLLLSTFIDGTLRGWREIWGLSDAGRFVSREQFCAALVAAGFVNARLETAVYSQRFTCFDSAVNSIRDLGAGHNGQDQGRGLMGRHKLSRIKAQINTVIQRSGHIELIYHVAFACATKRICNQRNFT